MNVQDIEVKKRVGSWKPNVYLGNLAIAYYEEAQYASKRLFPVCPVQLPSGHFYEFSLADLARDNVKPKPDYGKVAPAVLGHSDSSYSCKVNQVIVGIDQIIALPYQRSGAAFDPYRLRVRSITDQITLHQELEFAEKYFKAGVWANEWTGAAASNYANKQFKKFDNTDFDPVSFIDDRVVEIRRNGRRRPNKLALGMETYTALKNNPFILERIKYSGTTQNPAIVNENVLAQVFSVDEVVVLDATYNAADFGADVDMKFVCDSKGALLLYTPATPQIDTPSAGYTFTWLINGGDYIAIDTFEPNDGTHTDYMEGILAYDIKKTSDALAIYFADCVG